MHKPTILTVMRAMIVLLIAMAYQSAAQIRVDNDFPVHDKSFGGFEYYPNYRIQNDSLLIKTGWRVGTGKYVGGLLKFKISLDSILQVPGPLVDGSVFAVADDGTGGIYIGGNFSYVDSSYRSNFAHIDSLGTILETPNFEHEVISIIPIDHRLLIKTQKSRYRPSGLPQPPFAWYLYNGRVNRIESLVDTSIFRDIVGLVGLTKARIWVFGDFFFDFENYNSWTILDSVTLQIHPDTSLLDKFELSGINALSARDNKIVLSGVFKKSRQSTEFDLLKVYDLNSLETDSLVEGILQLQLNTDKFSHTYTDAISLGDSTLFLAGSFVKSEQDYRSFLKFTLSGEEYVLTGDRLNKTEAYTMVGKPIICGDSGVVVLTREKIVIYNHNLDKISLEGDFNYNYNRVFGQQLTGNNYWVFGENFTEEPRSFSINGSYYHDLSKKTTQVVTPFANLEYIEGNEFVIYKGRLITVDYENSRLVSCDSNGCRNIGNITFQIQGATGGVQRMHLVGDTLFVAGVFSQTNYQDSYSIVAIDLSKEDFIDVTIPAIFTYGPNIGVQDIKYHNGKLFICGPHQLAPDNLTTFNFSVVDIVNNTVPYRFSANGIPYSCAAVGNRVVVVGNFIGMAYNITGPSTYDVFECPNGVMVFDFETGIPIPWQAEGISGVPESVAVTPTTVTIATRIGDEYLIANELGTYRGTIRSYNITNGLPINELNDIISSAAGNSPAIRDFSIPLVHTTDSTLIAAGNFYKAEGRFRRDLMKYTWPSPKSPTLQRTSRDCSPDSLFTADAYSGYRWYLNDSLISANEPYIIPSEKGSYQLHIYDDRRQKWVVSNSIEIQEIYAPDTSLLPLATIGSFTCATVGSIDIEAPAGSNHVWYLNGEELVAKKGLRKITVSVPGDYFSIFKDECLNVRRTQTRTIVEKTPPEIHLTIQDSTLLASSSGAVQVYKWLYQVVDNGDTLMAFVENGSSESYTPLANGVFSVLIADTDWCQYYGPELTVDFLPDLYAISYNRTTNVVKFLPKESDEGLDPSNPKGNSELLAFPNPAKNSITLSSPVPLEPGYQVLVTSLSGEVFRVAMASVTEFELVLDLSILSNGVYTVSILQADKMFTTRICKY